MSGDSSIGIGIGLALKSYGRAFRGLLNQYPGAAAAYSLRKLSGAVSNVVRVRRSSDDAEQDFTAAQVDNGTLVNFANNDTSALYGNKMYFDGVDDYVSGSTFNLSSKTIRIKVLYPNDLDLQFVQLNDNANSGRYFGGTLNTTLDANDDIAFTTRLTSDNSLDSNFGVSSLSVSPGSILEIVITFNASGGIDSGTVNGVAISSITGKSRLDASNKNTGIYLGIRPDGAFPYAGVISDFEVDSELSWQGYGNTNADWEDQIGSNDGTVNGSPALYSGQGFDGFVATEYDQSGAVLRDGTQSTTTDQPQIVSDGALVTDGNGNVSTIWDGVNDDLDVVAGFAGLTAANVYAVTDNAGVVTLDTLTAQDISADTNLTTILTGITYDKVTAVIIYPDNTNQSAIQSEINTLFGI